MRGRHKQYDNFFTGLTTFFLVLFTSKHCIAVTFTEFYVCAVILRKNSPRSMGDAPASDVESSKPSPASEALPDLVNPAPAKVTSASVEDYHVDAFLQDRRPFGSLQFQVSEVVGRLEAGVNAQDAAEEEKKREPRKISAGFFEPEETGMDDILKVLEDLVLKTDPSCDSMDPPLLPTDAVTRAAILSHSISALFGRLERGHAARLGAHIAAETTRWLSHMFR